MKFKILISVLVLGILSTSSCDKIDPIIPLTVQYNSAKYGPAPTFENATDDMIVQRVLLEEFTGHLCGFCPPATVIAESIKENNYENVSLVAVHSGSLAQTQTDHFTMDWTCEEGDIYFGQLDEQSNPLGRVNRAPGQSDILPASLWETIVNGEMAQDPDAVIQMKANYQAADGELNVHVFTEFLNDLTGDIQLAVLITESHLFGDQKDYNLDPDLIEDYEFNYMLRGSITGALGVPLESDPLAGTNRQIDYTYEFNPDWVVENCHAVAIAFYSSTGEVVNVSEIHLSE